MSMMIPKCVTPKILAFDTSSLHGSVALLEGQDVRAEIRTNSKKTHSSMLLESVDFLLKRIGCEFAVQINYFQCLLMIFNMQLYITVGTVVQRPE